MIESRKRARAAGMFPAARALRSDVVRRAASRGGTLRCAEARRVAYRDVDVVRISSTTVTWLVARRLQDSPAAVIAISFDRAEKPRLEWDVTKPVTVGFGADGYDACAWCR
jgi:hypothetical protein